MITEHSELCKTAGNEPENTCAFSYPVPQAFLAGCNRAEPSHESTFRCMLCSRLAYKSSFIREREARSSKLEQASASDSKRSTRATLRKSSFAVLAVCVSTNFRLRTLDSDFRPPTSDFRLLTSDFRLPTKGLMVGEEKDKTPDAPSGGGGVLNLCLGIGVPLVV